MSLCVSVCLYVRRDVPVGVPLDLSTEWHVLPKYNGIQVSQLIYLYVFVCLSVCMCVCLSVCMSDCLSVCLSVLDNDNVAL